MIIKRFFNKLRFSFFPSEHERNVKKWVEADGDYKYRLFYDMGDQDVVVDVGGFKGQWASDIFSMYKSQIYVFEPVEGFAKQICKRFQKNDKIKVYPFGLGGRTRQEKLFIDGDRSSIFSSSRQKVTIRIVDVIDWAKEQKLNEIYLMKINIEGGEYELLERLLEADFVGNVRNLQVQFHDISKDSALRVKKLQHRLSETHKLTYQYPFVWENWQRL